MLLGKKIRLNRLFNHESGKYISIALDHAISYEQYEIPEGIQNISETIGQIVMGKPNSIILHKGIASKCFIEYANQVPLILQSTFYVPELPWKDYQISFIEEAIALGADAIAMSIGVIGDYQGEEVAMLSRLVKEAAPLGMPVIGHIYPKGNIAKPEDFYSVRYLQYAAHLGAEIGLDIVKIPYTGSPNTFKKVVASCPIKLVVAGGPNTSTLHEKLEMAYGVIEAGADGITFGRNVWQDDHIVAIISALKAIVYRGVSVKQAAEIYQEMSLKK